MLRALRSVRRKRRPLPTRLRLPVVAKAEPSGAEAVWASSGRLRPQRPSPMPRLLQLSLRRLRLPPRVEPWQVGWVPEN